MRRQVLPAKLRLSAMARIAAGALAAAVLTSGAMAAMALELERSFAAAPAEQLEAAPSSPTGRRGVVLVESWPASEARSPSSAGVPL